MNILITGASGYIGNALAMYLCSDHTVIGVSRRGDFNAPFLHLAMDVRDANLARVMRERDITHVVHLAAALDDQNAERAYDIDVNGTRNVLQACVAAGVSHITVSSSGAAYGYHADNPVPLREADPLRGNEEFVYSRNKRLVEEMLAEYREEHPELKQLVLRVCTVLGPKTDNPITRLFQRPSLLDVALNTSGFVLIWEDDLIRILEEGVLQSREGIYNVAGDGVLTLPQMSEMLDKRRLVVPAFVLQAVLWAGQKLGLSRYGPAHVNFLRYRPMLANDALKAEFDYQPTRSSADCFTAYCAQQSRGAV